MNVLVTGGAGFIGSHVVDALVQRGDTVAVVDNLSSGKKEYVNAQAEFFKVDIVDKAFLVDVFNRFRPDVVFHLAAQKSVRDSVTDPVNDLRINIEGTVNLLECAKSAGVQKMIYSSTGGAVYGDVSVLPTPEDTPCAPVSPYGTSKLAGEYYARCYAALGGPLPVILRYANVYGPRQDPYGEAGVVAIFVKKMLENEQPVINGDGNNTRDFVYVSDVVSANLCAMDSEKEGMYNVGTEIETSVNDIFREVKKATRSDVQEEYGPEKPGEQRRSAVLVACARKELGWEPQVALDEGIRKTVEWFQKNTISEKPSL